jgi:hypothetical protein
MGREHSVQSALPLQVKNDHASEVLAAKGLDGKCLSDLPGPAHQ